jgi:hypothetical protein
LLVVGILGAIPVLLGIRRRREAIRHRLRSLILMEAVYLGLAFMLVKAGRPPLEALLVGIAAAVLLNSFIKPRSRYIPASVRRKVKAEYESKTGKKFNPKKHEFDHEVPFSRGGSHTADNLRVMEKKRNRSKGAKSPWWDLLGR